MKTYWSCATIGLICLMTGMTMDSVGKLKDAVMPGEKWDWHIVITTMVIIGGQSVSAFMWGLYAGRESK